MTNSEARKRIQAAQQAAPDPTAPTNGPQIDEVIWRTEAQIAHLATDLVAELVTQAERVLVLLDGLERVRAEVAATSIHHAHITGLIRAAELLGMLPAEEVSGV